MKRITMFVLLFAALKVAGQTTGYLRFDTVKIMKQNGTCELFIINKTKDSLGLLTNVGGGLTRFIKPKMLNDSSMVIGLDTIVIHGASGGQNLSNASLTANGDYAHNWAQHPLKIDSIADTIRLSMFHPWVNQPLNKYRFNLNGYNSSVYQFALEWGLTDISGTGGDSAYAGITSSSLGTSIAQFRDYGSKYASIELNGGFNAPYVAIGTNDYGAHSNIIMDRSIYLSPKDSLSIKAVAAATADSALGIRKTRDFSGQEVSTVVKFPVPTPAGGSATLSNAGSGYRLVKTADGQVKTTFAGYGILKDSSSNTDGITDKADTSTLKAVYLPLNLNAAKTIRQYNNNIYFTAGGEVKSDSFKITRSTTFGSPTGLLGVGDSYIAGYRPCTPDTIFFDRLSEIYDLTGTNYGVSSTGIWRADSIHNYRVNPGHSFLSYVWAGFNDVRRGGITNDTTYRKVITGLKSIIANQFLKSWVAGGSTGSGVTRYGTWTTTYTCASVGGKSPNNGGYTNTNNDSIVYIFPAADTSVIIGTINGDSHALGYNMGTFDIYVDGSLWGSFNGLNADGISDGFNDNARSPNSFIITGLSNAVHRIKVVNTSSNYLVVDYFGHMKDITTSVPLLIGHAPYNNVAGFAVSPNKGSVAAMDKLNDQIDSMVSVTAVGWPIYVVPTNNYLDTLTGLCTDDIHPDNDGDIQITNATLSVLDIANTDVSNGTIAFTGTYFKGAANGVTHLIPWLDETLQQSDTSRFVRNQTSFDQNAGFRITNASLVKNKLTVGSASLSDGSDQLDVLTTAGHMRVLGFSSQHYWQSIDNSNTNGVAFNFGAAAINFGAISGGSTTNYVTFNNAASNKFTITGNALINSSVRMGSGLSATDAPITVGTVANLPYLSFYKSNAPSDQKIWDKIQTDSVYFFRTVNDAFDTPDTIYYAVRSGITPLRFIIPKATLNIGYLNMKGNGMGAFFNRSIGANKDSINKVSVSGVHEMLVIDTSTGKVHRADISSGGLSGSGTSGRIAYWNGSSSLTSNSNFLFNTTGPAFSVGTTNTQGVLNLGGNKDLSSSGVQSYFAGATYTDQTTAASGTASSKDINLIASPTIAAANSSVTYPFVSSVAIIAPTPGSNITITKPYALRLEASSGNNANLGMNGFIEGVTHIRSTAGSGATISAGSGAGTGASGSVTGNDMAGKIDITTGSSPSTSATVVTITFNLAYAATPTVILTPGNANAAALTGGNQVYVSSPSTTNFLVTSGSTAIGASTQYIWYYHVIQ